MPLRSMAVWHVVTLLLASSAPAGVHGLTECPNTGKAVNDAASLANALGSNGPLQLCLSQFVTFEEEPPLQIASGQDVSIYCGGRNITFYSNQQGPMNLASGATLQLFDCEAVFFSAAVALSVPVENARELTTTALTGASGSTLTLTDCTMMMPTAFPELFFRDIVQQSGDQLQQQQAAPLCTVGPHVQQQQFSTWAITFQTLELANGFASDNNAYGISASNTTFWGGPQIHAMQVVSTSIEAMQNTTLVQSCEDLEREAQWPSLEVPEDGATDAAASPEITSSDAAEDVATGGVLPVDAPEVSGQTETAGEVGDDLDDVDIAAQQAPVPEEGDGGGRGSWVTPVVVVICIVCVLLAFAVGYWIRHFLTRGKRAAREYGKYGDPEAAFPVYHHGPSHGMPPSGSTVPQPDSSVGKSSSKHSGAALGGAAPGAWHNAVAAAAASLGLGGGAAAGGGRDVGGRWGMRGTGARSVRYSDQAYEDRSIESARQGSDRRGSLSHRAGLENPPGGMHGDPTAVRKQDRSILLGEDSSGAQVPLLDSMSHKSNSTSMGTGAATVKEQVGVAIRRMEGDLLEQGEATLEEQLKIDNLIGRGAFGTVYRGEWRGLQVAIKTVVFQSDLVDGPMTRVASETVIASNLIHPNIVATYSHDISAVGKAADGEPELGVYKFYLIQEYCNAGSLRMAISSGRFLRPRMHGRWRPVMAVLKGIVCGMQYMHSKGICHGDLNPSNILVKANGVVEDSPGTAPGNLDGRPGVDQIQTAMNDLNTTVKLTDFGMSTRMDTKCSHRSNINHGTAFYIAPEVIWQQRLHRASDVYSFGVIMWEIMTGVAVFIRRADAPHERRSGDPKTFVHHPAFPSLPISVPLTFTLTMKACLSETPSERPTFGQIATIFEDLVFEVDTGTYISSSGQVMLSEGVQQDPCDSPARGLFLESPNPSIMPSSGGENPLVSSATTDYPEPSSAASWARAQFLLQQQQQQHQRMVPGSLTGAYSGSTAPPLSAGLCPNAYNAYNPSGMGLGSTTYPPESLNYGGGPMPPSSRGGVSGYSGTSRMSLSSQLLRSSFQSVLAEVPPAPQPQFPVSGDLADERGGPLEVLSNLGRSLNSTLPHPVTPDPNSGTPQPGSSYNNLTATGGVSSRNDTFYSAGGMTHRTALTADDFVSADEAFSPRDSMSGDSNFEQKSAWVLQPPGSNPGSVAGGYGGVGGANAVNSRSGMPEPLQPPLSGEAWYNGARITAENSQNDDRIGYADIPKHLLPSAVGTPPRHGMHAEMCLDVPDPAAAEAGSNRGAAGEQTRSAPGSAKSGGTGEGTGSISAPAHPSKPPGHNDSAALSLSSAGDLSSAGGSMVQEVTLAVANLGRSSANGLGKNSARNSRNSLGTLATKSSTLSKAGLAKPSTSVAPPNPLQPPLAPHIPRKSRASAEEFMMYNGLQPVSSHGEEAMSNINEDTQEDTVEGMLPVRASAVELLDQSNAFGASSAQQLDGPKIGNEPKTVKPPKPPRALHAFGRTLRPAARSLKSDSEGLSGTQDTAAQSQAPQEGNSSNLDSIIRANARRAMEAAQQRLVVETAQQSAAVAAAERAEHRERSRRRRTQRKHRIGGASGTSTSVHLCEASRMSVSGDAGSSRGGESASASAATNTFTPNSAMATVPPKPEATAQGQAPVPQSMGSTPSQHHPNPAYPDSADQGFADVSHGISLPSNSATTRGTAAGGPASVADSPYRFMAPNIVSETWPVPASSTFNSSNNVAKLPVPAAPSPLAAAPMVAGDPHLNWQEQVVLHAKKSQKNKRHMFTTPHSPPPPHVPANPAAAVQGTFDNTTNTNTQASGDNTNTNTNTLASSITARNTRVSYDARDRSGLSLDAPNRVSADAPRTPASPAAAAAANAMNLLNGTTNTSHGDAPTAAETAAAAASASAVAAANRSQRWHHTGGSASSTAASDRSLHGSGTNLHDHHASQKGAAADAAAAAATLGVGGTRASRSPSPLRGMHAGHAYDHRDYVSGQSPDDMEPEESASLPPPSAGFSHLTGASRNSPPPQGGGYASPGPMGELQQQSSDLVEDSSGSVPGMRAVHATNRKSHHKAWQEHLQTMQELNFPRQQGQALPPEGSGIPGSELASSGVESSGFPQSIPEALQLQVPQTLLSRSETNNPVSSSSMPRPGVPLAGSQPNSNAGTSSHDFSGISSGAVGGGGSSGGKSRYGIGPHGDRIPIIRRIWA